MAAPFLSGGQPLTQGGVPFLAETLSAASNIVYTGSHPSQISGLSGWYDAGAMVMPDGVTPTLRAPGGTPLTTWWNVVGSVVNQVVSGLPNMAVSGGYSTGANFTGVVGVPRLVHTLGGIFAQTFFYQTTVAPSMDPTAVLKIGGTIQCGKGGDWFRYIVCSAANPPPPGNGYWGALNGGLNYVPILAADYRTRVLDITLPAGVTDWTQGCDLTVYGTGSGSGGLGSTVIPAATLLAAGIVLGARWTHSFAIEHSHTLGTSIWVDDTLVASGITPPTAYPASVLSALYVLNAGYYSTCLLIFHEMVTAERVLTAGEKITFFTSPTSISKRWVGRGPRKGYRYVQFNQSNGADFASNGGPFASGGFYLTELARYYLGALSMTLDDEGGAGTPMFGAPYIVDNTAGVDPLGLIAGNTPWPYGVSGNTFVTNWNAQPAWAKNDAVILSIFWNEGDSLRFTYAQRSLFRDALRRMVQLIRATMARTPLQCPASWNNAIAYSWTNPPFTGVGQTLTMFREVLADLIDPAGSFASENWQCLLPQTSVGTPDGASQLPDGTLVCAPSLNGAHQDIPSWLMYGKAYGAGLARAFMDAGFGEFDTTIPVGIAIHGGPSMTAAQYEGQVGTTGTSTVLVTITHDSNLGPGADVILAKLALNGTGWEIVVAVSSGSPTSVVQATAAIRIDPTHIRLTFPAIYASVANTRVYFIHNNDVWYKNNTHIDPGSGAVVQDFSPVLGLGNFPTDNAALLARPVGSDVGADMGPGWVVNMPMQASTYGTPLSA